MRRSPKRAVIISIFVIAISVFNFSRIPGSDCIRPIHIVTLVTVGLGLGVLLASVLVLLRNKSNEGNV